MSRSTLYEQPWLNVGHYVIRWLVLVISIENESWEPFKMEWRRMPGDPAGDFARSYTIPERTILPCKSTRPSTFVENSARLYLRSEAAIMI
jgi:hypothetical protein